MCDRRDFAGRGRAAAADQAGVADRVVRRAKRPRGQQRLAGFQQAHRGVDARRFDRFAGDQRGQDRRHALGEHRLAGAGRAEHQQIVRAGGGDRDRPLGHLLAADVGEIDVVGGVLVEPLVEPRRRGLDVDLAGEEGDGLREAADGDDFDLFDDGGFGGAGGGHDEAAKAALLGGGDGHRERALGRPREAVEGQLADDGVLLEPVGGELPAGGEHAERDRQIERRGLLGQLGRGEVDDDAVVRAHEAGVDERPLDAMRALLDGRFGQADEHGLGQRAGRDIDLDLDRQGVDAEEREGVELGEHGPSALPNGLREEKQADIVAGARGDRKRGGSARFGVLLTARSGAEPRPLQRRRRRRANQPAPTMPERPRAQVPGSGIRASSSGVSAVWMRTESLTHHLPGIGPAGVHSWQCRPPPTRYTSPE